MNTIYRSSEFDAWIRSLRDQQAKARIFRRIENAQRGNFGDNKALGGGLSEMRVDCGPGYRLYYTRKGEVVYFLLVGGDKSTQQEDIVRARRMIEE